MDKHPDKKRKENWTKGEVEALLTGYINNHSEIESRFSIKLTAQVKEACWQDILESVNSQSSCTRTINELKKKWSDLKMAIKKKERERRLFASKTGGGPPPANPDSLEEKVLQLIGESTVAGISGVDTFRENLSSSISNMSNVQEASCTNDGDADASSSGNLAESAPSATLVNTSNSEKRKRTVSEPLDKYQELLDIERKKCKFLEEILNTQKQQNENLGAISNELKRLTDIIACKSSIDNLIEL